MKYVTKLLAIIALVTVAAFTIAACKSADEKAADSLQGKFKNAETGIEITFKDKNVTWKMEDSESKGTFVVAGDLLTFNFTEGDFKGLPMAFQFNLKGNTLTFKSGGFSGVEFKKQ